MIRNYLPLFVLVLLLFGCRSTTTDKGPEMEDVETGFGEIEEVKEVYYRFPSPDEMLNFIDKEELSFQDDILLPIEYANGYLDSRSQALNLGVYVADLAYITLFQRQKEALMYMQVVYGLSEKLRIAAALDIELMKRFDDNFDNPDSLKVLADAALTDITDFLIANDKEKTFALMSIGGFVESLHLAFDLAGEYSEDNEVVQRISDQKYVLDNLLNYCLEHAEDESISKGINYLHPIRVIYNDLLTSTEETSVSKEEDGKLVISGGSRIKMSEEQYNELQLAVKETRKKITENQEN